MDGDSSNKQQQQQQRVPMDRPGLAASRGRPISLLTNHFKVSMSKPVDNHFHQYSVSIKYEDDTPVNAKGIANRNIINKLQETYSTDFGAKMFAYDGEKVLFTIGPLPEKNPDVYLVIIHDDASSHRSRGQGSQGDEGSSSDTKRLRRQARSKTYKVGITYATQIPTQAIASANQEALRVLDIILRQNAAQKGCLIVRQSFFHNEPNNFVDIGGGVLGCRGFHSSFRPTQAGGLSLNMDVSTTMIVKPGPVMDFLLSNQNIRHPREINWDKAKRTLRNLRIKVSTTAMEYKITGLSDFICKDQTFLFKHTREGASDATEVEITVYDYFVKHREIPLKYSQDFPCINVGKKNKPTYLPVELCSLVSLQRYTKALTNLQRASLVEKSRQKPQERMNTLRQALASSNYAADSLLQSCGISISSEFNRIEGRIWAPPKLRVGKNEDFVPSNGRWNFNNKHVIKPIAAGLENWAAVSFSDKHKVNIVRSMCERLISCANNKGISIKQPLNVFEEDVHSRRNPAATRVDRMIVQMRRELQDPPQFILCVLPERKNSDLYGPWKRKNLTELGVVTQCIAPPPNVKDQYLTNVLLKINAKLGGMNSLLSIERPQTPSLVCRVPTLIIGMDVSHGSPGRDVPSIAAVVSSREWPLISKYRAVVRLQSARSEIIDSLFKPNSGTKDQGIFGEILDDFYDSSNNKPEQIIIFRDGVSESQFDQVLNKELDQIIQACKVKDENWNPKFMLVVAQKNHHAKFFQQKSPDNVPPGTVIDSGVCHPTRHDFYMCAHAGMIGTTRPTHYHVLHDEIGFSPDDLQEFVHSLSYVYQRSTTAISVVAPICYAHLAAAQVSQFVKFDEGCSERASTASGGSATAVPELPRLHHRICNTMFFC